MERKALELIKKHMSDFGDCLPGLEDFGNLISDAVRQGIRVLNKIIELFEAANIDVEIFKRQFNEKYIVDGDAIFNKDKTDLIKFEPSSDITEYEIFCYVSSKAFIECKLEKIIVSNNVKGMGSEVFMNCRNLKEITFNNAETRLDNNCFLGCSDALVIKAPVGGYIEEYAKQYNIIFESI